MDLKQMQISKEASINLAAGCITAGAGAACYYWGGKALLTTVAVVGGGIFAAAVTHEVAKRTIVAGGELFASGKQWMERERMKREQRPVVQREAPAAPAAAAAAS